MACAHLDPVHTAQHLVVALHTRHGKWRQVTTVAAKNRHAVALARMGIRPIAEQLAVEASSIAYFHFWIAFLRKGARERIVAVDGVTGKRTLWSAVL